MCTYLFGMTRSTLQKEIEFYFWAGILKAETRIKYIWLEAARCKNEFFKDFKLLNNKT